MMRKASSAQSAKVGFIAIMSTSGTKLLISKILVVVLNAKVIVKNKEFIKG